MESLTVVAITVRPASCQCSGSTRWYCRVTSDPSFFYYRGPCPPSLATVLTKVTKVTAIIRSLKCSDGVVYPLTYFSFTRNTGMLVNVKRNL